MKKIEIVFLDMDGVIVDLGSPLMTLPTNVIYNKSGKETYSQHYELGKWDIFDDSLFDNIGEEFWTNLNWTPDGKEILSGIEEKYGKDNVFILSTPTGTGSLQGKYNWIQKNIPDYSKRYFFGNPKFACSGMNKLLIDDSDRNINQFIKAGGNGILVPRFWNSKYDLVE